MTIGNDTVHLLKTNGRTHFFDINTFRRALIVKYACHTCRRYSLRFESYNQSSTKDLPGHKIQKK